MTNSEQNRIELASVMWHLAKGICKSIPFAGPVVEEAFFNLVESEAAKRLASTPAIAKLDNDQVHKLVSQLPSREELLELDHKLTAMSESGNEHIALTKDMFASLQNWSILFKEALQSLEGDLSPLPRLAEAIDDISSKIEDAELSKQVIDAFEQRKRDWCNRLSRNQRKLLEFVPETPTPLSELWHSASVHLGDCGYKEFRFRLHELEWLDLVRRELPECGCRNDLRI